MTSGPSQRPVSALRARMIEDMTVRGFNERTRSHYVRHVRAFAALSAGRPTRRRQKTYSSRCQAIR
jgi:integrase/recombinase XerD